MVTLTVRGSIENVLYCRVEPGILHELPAEQNHFSFGLGGIGESVEKAVSQMGELVAIPGMAGVLPGDGEFRSKTVTTGKWFSPFAVELTGLEDQVLQPISEGEITGGGIWSHISDRINDSDNPDPLIGAIWTGRVRSFRGAYVLHPLVPSSAPAEGLPISDPSVHADWFGLNPNGGYTGKWVLVVGVAMKDQPESLQVLQGKQGQVFYRNPHAPLAYGSLMVHQHALIFDTEIYHPNGKSSHTVAEQVREKDILDIKHVLDDSVFDTVYGCWLTYNNINNL